MRIPYYDLRKEARAGHLPALVGRADEMRRLDRLIDRRVITNALIVGPSGIGKTALIHGWIRRLDARAQYARYALVQLAGEHLHEVENDDEFEDHTAEGFNRIPSSIIFIDDFGRAVYHNAKLVHHAYRLYKRLLVRPDVHVILALEPHEHAYLEREYPAFTYLFEEIIVKAQTAHEHLRVLIKKMPRLRARSVIVTDDSLREIVALAERFPALGTLPRSAICLLDESIAEEASRGERILTPNTIAQVVETKTGIPKARVSHDALRNIKDLDERLRARIIGQDDAIAPLAAALRRARLGLRNPQRPLGSFLMLGPSGVGKTETAKCVAENMFGAPESCTRIDMSEFQQEHTVQRLIGAPPGYVGCENGGALTNALRAAPHSLVLLDEIEKAHPKVFDVFLQVLDDGHLTSGTNEMVDARNAIIMATSNAAVPEILDACESGADLRDQTFIRERVVPILAKTFRLEFINRFDAILIFRPLAAADLMRIARLEVKKIETRLAHHRVTFKIDPGVLEDKIRHLVDPRFGARPVKRFIEETCENLIAQSLLAGTAHL